MLINNLQFWLSSVLSLLINIDQETILDLLGVLAMAAVPAGLITIPFIENVNKFQNPFRRPISSLLFILGFVVAVWLGIGACLPIDKAVSLGFW